MTVRASLPALTHNLTGNPSPAYAFSLQAVRCAPAEDPGPSLHQKSPFPPVPHIRASALSGKILFPPPKVVSMIVGKAVNMCKMMNISVLGLVENMSYMECPCCKEHLHPFGNSKIEEVSLDYHLTALDQMPIQPEVASLVDQGLIEEADPSVLDKAAKALENLIK